MDISTSIASSGAPRSPAANSAVDSPSSLATDPAQSSGSGRDFAANLALLTPAPAPATARGGVKARAQGEIPETAAEGDEAEAEESETDEDKSAAQATGLTSIAVQVAAPLPTPARIAAASAGSAKAPPTGFALVVDGVGPAGGEAGAAKAAPVRAEGALAPAPAGALAVKAEGEPAAKQGDAAKAAGALVKTPDEVKGAAEDAVQDGAKDIARDAHRDARGNTHRNADGDTPEGAHRDVHGDMHRGARGNTHRNADGDTPEGAHRDVHGDMHRGARGDTHGNTHGDGAGNAPDPLALRALASTQTQDGAHHVSHAFAGRAELMHVEALRTETGVPPAPTGRSEAPPPQVAQTIAAIRASDGARKIEIRLDPADLGSVDIQLSIRHHSVTAVVSVDNSHSLDLMRRHADHLGRELSRAGFGEVDMQFRQGGGRRREEGFAAFAKPLSAVGSADPVNPAASTAAAAPVRVVRAAGLDIRL